MPSANQIGIDDIRFQLLERVRDGSLYLFVDLFPIDREQPYLYQSSVIEIAVKRHARFTYIEPFLYGFQTYLDKVMRLVEREDDPL